ncbi:hypothetical protein HYT51_00250, partial [Candidatus Woesearchaeota archaeon]|nr:hypothetical protein [Candidatus Woesearchaeota archaeon]
ECKELWVDEGWFGQWDCEKNCDCNTAAYADRMNTFCRSLGDCGLYYNVVGERGDSGAGFSGPVIEVVEGHAPDRGDVDDRERWNVPFRFDNIRIDGDDLKVEEDPLTGSLYLLLYMTSFSFARDPLRDTRGFFEGGDWQRSLWTSGAFAAIGAGIPVLYVSTLELGLSFGTTISFWSAGLASLKSVILHPLSFFNIGGVAIASTVAWAAAIFFVISKFVNKASVATVTYTFNCQPWVAPVGGDDCEKCDDFTVCDKYKCESLGQACKLENENTGNETCVWTNKNDAVPPVITPLPIEPRTQADFIYTPVSLGNRGYEFKEEVPVYTTLQVGVKTNEKAQCRISKGDIPFDDMTTLFNDGLIKEEHRVEIPSFRGTAPNEDVFTSGGGNYLFYVKCRDINNNKNRESYFIKFNMEDELDRVPPVIEEFSVPDNAFIPSGTRNFTLVSYLNEPIPVQGGCKYSLNDVPYNNMENDMTCSGNVRVSLNRYSCTATLNGLRDSVDNVFYFRCRD